jgi:DNA-binding response OmpR family regulator
MADPIILIADDDEALLGLMLRRMVRLGYPADTAADGQKAADLLRAKPYDLLVTDINMPGLSGLDLLALAKSIDPQMQVVIVTGGATMDTAVQALNQGAFGYLTKPFDHLSVFENTVLRALEYRRLTLDNLRLGEIQKRRGDMLEDEVTERLKQVSRQDREIREILSHLPQGILILGGRRGLMPGNPAGKKWLSVDAEIPEHPLSSYIEELRRDGRAPSRVIILAERTLKLESVNLAKDGKGFHRVLIIQDLTEPGREVASDMAEPLAGMLQELKRMAARRPTGEEREVMIALAREVQALEGIRRSYCGVERTEATAEASGFPATFG